MTKRAIFRLILIVVAIIAAFFVYRFVFVAGPPPETPGVEPLSSSINPAAPVDDQFFKLLERVRDIQLEPELVFNHPVWKSLENFRRELGDEPRGRQNPFTPPGADDLLVGESASTTLPGAASTTRGR
ncbi:MAG: hypothetical protein AAB677_00080 [Patescibacteria group bacterium]